MTTEEPPSVPLNIVQISAEYPPDPGGVGDYSRLLSRALLARGHQVAVLTGGRGSGSSRPAAGDDPTVFAAVERWTWRALPQLQRALQMVRPDIVHIQYQTGAYGMHPAIDLLPWWLHRRTKPRPYVVVTAHDLRLPYLFPKAAPLRYWVTGRLLRDADAVIVTNAADQQILVGHAQSDPDLFRTRRPLAATVIPIGSNIAATPPSNYERTAWRQEHDIPPDALVIAFFGLMSPTKGLREVIEAMPVLPQHIHLLVVGGEAVQPQDRAYRIEMLTLIERMGLTSRVTITGYCDPPTVSGHLLAADIGVLPFVDGASYRRGSLLAILAHGLPLVTTQPVEPLSPPLEDGVHAVLVPPGDQQGLVAALQSLIKQPDLRARLAAEAPRLAAHFSWSSIAAAHEHVYNATLGRGNRR